MALLDQGIYRGTITGQDFGKSKGKGTRFFEIRVYLQEKETRAGSDEFVELEQPTTRSVFFWLSPKAIDMSMANIRSLGYTEDTLRKLHPASEDRFDLTDKEVKVRVTHEPYTDQRGNERTSEKVELVRQSARLKVEIDALGDLDDVVATIQAKASGKDNASGLFSEEKKTGGDVDRFDGEGASESKGGTGLFDLEDGPKDEPEAATDPAPKGKKARARK
jgi:hypothetical protein